MKTFVKDNFDFHSWLGVLSAALLFVVAFSGSIALFHNELATWENPERRVAYSAEKLSVDHHWEIARTQAGFDYNTFFLSLPSSSAPYFHFWHYDAETEKTIDVLTHPATGEILEKGDSDIAHLLAHLHTDLHLPRPFGRYLVGLTGIIMMSLLLTGVFTHRKILKEMFTLRQGKSLRALFSGAHKLIGVWGLPFHLLMAFTGAIIGLLGIIGVFMALASFGGSVEKASEAFLGPRATATGTTAEMHPIDGFVTQTKAHWEGFTPTFIRVEEAGDAGALVTVQGDVDGRLAMASGVTWSMASGEKKHVTDWHDKGLPTLLFGMVVPLHYAQFGGIWIKYLYLGLGLGMAFLILSGTGIWLERRERARAKAGLSGVSYVTRIHIGVTGGLVAASATLFLVNHLGAYVNQGLLERLGFWGVWAGAIVYAVLRNRIKETSRELITLAGVSALLAPGVNGIVTGDMLWTAPGKGLYAVMAVDITLVVCGLLLLIAAWYPQLKVLIAKQSTSKTSDTVLSSDPKPLSNA